MSSTRLASFFSLALLLSLSRIGALFGSKTLAGPVITLDYGSFQGNATGNLVKFLGMPFAAPPVGNLRFAHPKLPQKFAGVRKATSFGAACPQQATSVPPMPGRGSGNITSLVSSEDCLFINVITPANIPAGRKLPVLFWIYGGGFQNGDTSIYAGDTVVARSIDLGEPVIYVSANYRLNVFGFLGGKEAQAANIGNAGLRDQRFALEWVQKHIAVFGGDPDRVTIWGESAGAMSVGFQLVIHDGDSQGLFHGAFMQSGSPFRLLDITAQQPLFDQLVAKTGCTGSADLIACLRGVPLDQLMTAVNTFPNVFSYTSIRLGWQPSVDGHLIVRDPQVSLQKGLYAKVPFVIGACDDEGTLFSLSTLNITNNAEFLVYIQANYFEGLLSAAELTQVSLAYPDDITKGSPFDTGTANALSPEFKRMAAFQGDQIFQAPRRFLLEHASKTQTAFAFLFKRGKAIPNLGAFHSFDLPEFYGKGTAQSAPDFIGTDALVNFANTGNPTTPPNPKSLLSTMDWQPWNSSADHPLLTFLDPAPNVSITFDDFRIDEMKLLNDISLELAGR